MRAAARFERNRASVDFLLSGTLFNEVVRSRVRKVYRYADVVDAQYRPWAAFCRGPLLLGDLKHALGVSHLFISHDLGGVHHISDRVLMMNQGRVVESGEVDEIFLGPRAEYTKRLVAAVPRLVRDRLAVRSSGHVEESSV